MSFREATKIVTDNRETTPDEQSCKNRCVSKIEMVDGKEVHCTHYRWKRPENAGVEGVCEYFSHTSLNGTGAHSYNCSMTAASIEYANKDKKKYYYEKYEACKNPTPPGVREGNCFKRIRVQDALKGTPVHEAVVTWDDGIMKILHTNKTDPFGELMMEVSTNLETGKLTVSKEGYDDQEREFEVNNCQDAITVVLNPTSKDGRIILSWDKDIPPDLDLHLSEFKGNNKVCDISWEDKSPRCSSHNLDIDNTRGGSNGPETVTIKDAGLHTSVVFVHMYTDVDGKIFCNSGAHVTVCEGSDGCQKHHDIPTGCSTNTRYWLVGCFTGATGLGKMKVINKLMDSKADILSECGDMMTMDTNKE